MYPDKEDYHESKKEGTNLSMIDTLKKIGTFLILKRYAPLRMTIIIFLIVSTMTLMITLGMLHNNNDNLRNNAISGTNDELDKNLIVENFTIIKNVKFFGLDDMKNLSSETVAGYITFMVKTNRPAKIMLILDNQREKTGKTIESKDFEKVTTITQTFSKDEIYRQFIVSGKATDEQGFETRLDKIYAVPGANE